MPQLNSGRHFGIAASNFVEVLVNGSDTQKQALVMTLRLEVTSPEALLPHTRVVYFHTSEGLEPPHAPAYDSGFTIGMIQNGESDWSDVEVQELSDWLNDNTQIDGWLEQQFDQIDLAIQRCSVVN